MSDTAPNTGGNGHRRSSITQAALTNLFSRGPPFPNGGGNEPQRRRLSITTVGLSGTSPTNTASFIRRGSMSTNSDSIDENAIEDEDGPFGGSKTAPTTPFVRHMSFSGPPIRGFRQGGSPGNGNTPDSPQSFKLGLHYNGPKGQRYPPQSQSISQAPGTTISAAYTTARRRASLVHPTSSFTQTSTDSTGQSSLGPEQRAPLLGHAPPSPSHQAPVPTPHQEPTSMTALDPSPKCHSLPLRQLLLSPSKNAPSQMPSRKGFSKATFIWIS